MRFTKDRIVFDGQPLIVNGVDIRELLKPYYPHYSARQYTDEELDEMVGDVIKYTAYEYCRVTGERSIEEEMLLGMINLVWHELGLPSV